MPDEPDELIPPPAVVLADFATRHGIHPMLTRLEVNAGRLRLAQYGVGHHARALDLWGQAQFWVLYHDAAGFVVCEQCPHGVDTGERIEQGRLFAAD